MKYKNYLLKIADKDDIIAIMSFIKQEWDENHILAVDKAFFEYEYLNDDDSVNFVLAKNTQTNEIDAVHAFYILNEERIDFFGGLWKSKNGTPPMLGIVLKRFLYNLFGEYRSFSAIGSNPNTTIPIQQYFNFKTGKLNHFYLLGENSEYKIAIVNEKPIEKSTNIETSYGLKKIDNFKELLNEVEFNYNKNIVPFKSSKYINHRYFNHPVYKYDVYLIINSNRKTNAYLIIREIEVNGSKIGRIVDYIGNEKYIALIGESLKQLISYKNYEYIDFYNIGIDTELLLKSGFSLRLPEDVNIIPNYFEPFVQQNVDIYYHIANESCRICKADSDQDRPNILGG